MSATFAIGIEKQDEPVSAVGDRLLAIQNSDGQVGLAPYWSNYDLDGDKPLPQVEHLLLVRHGMLRNSETYWRIGLAAAQAANLEEETLVIADSALTDKDLAAWQDIPNMPQDPAVRSQLLYWGSGIEGNKELDCWKDGDDAISGVTGISSYDVQDHFVWSVLSNRRRFPNIKRVSKIGSSAGGVEREREAATASGPADEIIQENGIYIHNIASNPGTHLYFDERRPRMTAIENTYPPEDIMAVNDWRYGFGEYKRPLPRYVKERGTLADHRRRFVAANLTLMIGLRDAEQTIGVEQHAAAMAQGRHRLERAGYWDEHVEALRQLARQEGEARGDYRYVRVPEVSHDTKQMFTSPEGLEAIFG
jgi:hypothetical protein